AAGEIHEGTASPGIARSRVEGRVKGIEKMLTLIRCSLALVIGLICQPAYAIWFRTESVEWWTNVSDVIVVAEVSSVNKIEPLNELWDSQSVTCKPTAVLKGKSRKGWTFRQDFLQAPNGQGKDNHSGDQQLKKGGKVLLFCKQPETAEKEVLFWIN